MLGRWIIPGYDQVFVTPLLLALSVGLAAMCVLILDSAGSDPHRVRGAYRDVVDSFRHGPELAGLAHHGEPPDCAGDCR